MDARKQQIFDNITQLKTKLKKRLINPIDNAFIFDIKTEDKTHQTSVEISGIQFKDIIATQIATSSGEFSFDTTDLSSDGLPLENESNNNVIKRILKVIIKLIEVAKTEHLQDNYSHPDLFLSNEQLWQKAKQTVINELTNQLPHKKFFLDPELIDPLDILKTLNSNVADGKISQIKHGHENNVTRLMTNEFFFYPLVERGPLTQDDFLMICRCLEILAKYLPENLQYIFASFPVIDPKTMVTENNTVILESSPNIRLHVFSKSITSDQDPYYLNGKTYQYYFISKKELIKIMKDRTDTLLTQMINHLQKDHMQLTAEHFEKITHYLSFFNYNSANILKWTLYQLKKHIKLSKFKKVNAAAYAINLSRGFNELKIDLAYNTASHEELLTPSIGFGSVNQLDSINSFFGKIIDSETAGGLRFSLILDICIEHRYQIAQSYLKQQIYLSELDATNNLPKFASHLVTSNSIKLISQSIVTDNEIIIQSDPFESNIRSMKNASLNGMLQEVKIISSPSFGSQITIDIYKSKYIDIIRPELLPNVPDYQELMLTLQALRIYRSNHPYDKDITLFMINELIHDYLIDKLKKYYNENKIPIQLINCIIDYLEKMDVDKKSFRKNFISFLIFTIKKLEEKSRQYPSTKEAIYILNIGLHLFISDQRDIKRLSSSTNNKILENYYKNNHSLWTKPSYKNDSEHSSNICNPFLAKLD